MSVAQLARAAEPYSARRGFKSRHSPVSPSVSRTVEHTAPRLRGLWILASILKMRLFPRPLMRPAPGQKKLPKFCEYFIDIAPIVVYTLFTTKGVVMNAREERGLVIAATQKLTQKGKVWLVPSQSGKGKYTVCPDPENPYCSCPDHEDHGGKCKHLYAVERLCIEIDF